MPLKQLRDFLDSHNIRYIVISHSRAYTAQETAQAAHIPGHAFAKTTVVKIDGRMAMAVLPASEKVDVDLLRTAAQARKAELAGESEFQGRFPECEIGAMPPFGNLYDMDVYMEESLSEENRIAFNAGSHTELIQMSCRDYRELVKAKVVRISAVYSA